MSQPPWIKLNREQSKKVLQQLGSHKEAVVFSPDVTDVSWRNLPFYMHYQLYRLINYATMPTFSMTYLSNGEDYIPLDGTANPIYTVNEKDPILLNEENIIPYLEFFFSHVQGSEGDVFLVKDPNKMPFMGTFSADLQKNVISSFKPITIEVVEGAYKVSGTLYYGSGLIAATILITPDGKMSFQDQSLLLSGIHFPDSPYGQNWIEG